MSLLKRGVTRRRGQARKRRRYSKSGREARRRTGRGKGGRDSDRRGEKKSVTGLGWGTRGTIFSRRALETPIEHNRCKELTFHRKPSHRHQVEGETCVISGSSGKRTMAWVRYQGYTEESGRLPTTTGGAIGDASAPTTRTSWSVGGSTQHTSSS